MRKFAVSAIAAAVALSAVPAFAGEARWSDQDYLLANRCLGLAQSAPLGELASGDLAKQIKSQGFGRNAMVTDRGAALKIDATRDGKAKDEARKAQLLAERESVCKAFIGGAIAASGSATPS